MKRRDRVDAADPPESLHRIDPRDWPEATPEASLGAWEAAREAWRARHGWPVDSIDFLRELVHERRRARLMTFHPEGLTTDDPRRTA